MPQVIESARFTGSLAGKNFSTSNSFTAKEIERGKFLGEPNGDRILVRAEGGGQSVRSLKEMGLLPIRHEDGRPVYSASQSTAIFQGFTREELLCPRNQNSKLFLLVWLRIFFTLKQPTMKGGLFYHIKLSTSCSLSSHKLLFSHSFCALNYK